MTADPAARGAAMTPGEALRRWHRALGLTAAQLAAAIGCSAVTLSHAETGRRVPPREWWLRADSMTGAGGELVRLYDGTAQEPGPVWPVWDEGPAPGGPGGSC